MSDNRRVHRTIRMALKQIYPPEPKGNLACMLTPWPPWSGGLVLGKSCQLPAIAREAPDRARADSRIKRYSRWIQNERVDYESYGPVTVIARWQQGYSDPLFLVTNFELADEAIDWCKNASKSKPSSRT